jgi:hypothetical protein
LGLPIDRLLNMTSPDTIKNNKNTAENGSKNRGLRNLFMGDYSTTIKRIFQLLLGIAIIFVLTALLMPNKQREIQKNPVQKESYWLLLHRKSNVEYLYKGMPGEKEKSKIVKKFQVKSGVPGQKPTPLPKLLGREYWLITGKVETKDSPETAPYFLILDIPYSEDYPYGPTPYLECSGQCDWVLPGSFGLHGINGDTSRLGSGNPGSSGCVRHKDEDIAYLYNLFDPEKEKIRYYIEDI